MARDPHAPLTRPTLTRSNYFMSPELGHNRSTSERNDFFNMCIGGTDNPLTVRDSNGNPIEIIDLTIDEVIDLTVDEDSVMTDVVDNVNQTPNAPALARAGGSALRMLTSYVVDNVQNLQVLLEATDVAHREAISTLLTVMLSTLTEFENDDLVQMIMNNGTRRRLFNMEEEDEEDNN